MPDGTSTPTDVAADAAAQDRAADKGSTPSDELGSFLADQAKIETTRVALDAQVNPPTAPVEDTAAQKKAEAAQKEAEAAAEKTRQVAVDGKLKELVGREDLKGFLQRGNRDAVLTWHTDPTTGENNYPQAILTRDGKVDVQFGNDDYAEGRVTFAIAQVDASGKYVDGDGKESYTSTI